MSNITDNTADRSARAILNETLANFGLSSLGDFAWQEYLQNIPLEQIMLDIRQRPEYKQRFPAMADLAARGKGMTESQYIQYENSAKEVLKAAGLPSGFYDSPDDFAGFLTKDIGLPELQDRVKVAQNAVYNFAPEDLQALDDFYHINGRPGEMVGDITAYILNENRALPAIQSQFVAAHTAGIASRTGFDINQNQAEYLATLGITESQAQQGFGTLANLEPLFAALPGEQGAPTREQGIQGVFADNAQAKAAVEAQGKKRRSDFQAGGAFSQTQQGYSGVGNA